MAQRISDFLRDYKVRLFDDLDVPIITATVDGTAGSTSYSYKATYKTICGETEGSETVVVTNGNATLSGFNRIRLTATNIPDLATHVRFWKYDSGAWKLLAEVAASIGEHYDTGAALTTATIPTDNTSGRPGVIAIMPKPATWSQRQSWIDMVALMSDMVQDLAESLHRDGDVISGCHEYSVGTNKWGFTSGTVYVMGRFLPVPENTTGIQLVGTGTEKVGLTITPVYSTPDDDTIQRCAEDEGCPAIHASTGPDWLYFQLDWVKDEDGMLVIKEFIDGIPKTATLAPERTELDRTNARRTNAVSGSFCVRPFQRQVMAHPTDDDLLQLKIQSGYAFINGYEVETVATQSLGFYRGRTDGSSGTPDHVATVENSTSDDFAYDGAYNDWNYWAAETVYALNDIVVPPVLNGYRYKVTNRAGEYKSGAIEPEWTETPNGTLTDGDLTLTCLGDDYDLNGLALDITVGSGNTHTVTFAADNMSAADVVLAIESEVNAYPTAGEPDLVYGTSSEAILQLQAIDGKSLTLAGAAALKQLGWKAATTTPTGTRIYQINDDYIKQVTSIAYKTERVVQVTYNPTTKKNLLSSNLDYILGACDSTGGGADPQKNAHDHKWDLELGVDFEKNGNYIDFSGLAGDEPGSGTAVTYYVKIREVRNATKGARQLIRVVDAKVTKAGEDLPDNLTYTDATTITRVSNSAAVTPTGNPIEVIEIERVNNSPGQSTDQYTSYNLVTNSGALEHGTSYIDWSAAGTPGTTGAGQPNSSATYYVTYLAWFHSTEGDVVTADCYDDYDLIGYAPNGTWHLRDCLDFRTTSSTLPKDGEDASFNYDYYLPRVDKLVVDDAGTFQLLTGTPAADAPTPLDQSSTLTIAVLRIPPYTYSPGDVDIVSTEPMRTTQKGIQRLQERIERLEWWQAKNDLEAEAEGRTPEGADTQGIFTDPLIGFNHMDLAFNKNGVTCNVSLDRNEQCIMLPFSENKKLVSVDEVNSTHIKRLGNSVILDYEPVVIIDQPKAGVYVNGATDYTYTNYSGVMTLTPQTSVWVDEEQLPQVNVDFDTGLSALLDVIDTTSAPVVDYGSWWRHSAANWSANGWRWQVNNYFRTRTETTTSLVPGALQQETINGIVDLSLQYFMRTTDENGDPYEIQLRVDGLMPNVDHVCTINGIAVDMTYDSSPVGGVAYGSQSVSSRSVNGASKTAVTSSNTGSLTAKFNMPTGVLSGTATIQVFYYADSAASSAYANFYSAGLTAQEQSTTIGIPTIATETTVTQTEELWREWGPIYYIDPIAQTFVLDEDSYISEVRLFFKSKSSTLGYRVELRDVVNGLVGNRIYASKHLESSEINVSDDSSAITRFIFDNVLQYKAGTWFVFVGFPDQSNTDYNLWCSELGTVDMLTGQRILTHPAPGSMLHSPNAVTWSSEAPWSKRDLKFQICKSNFEDNARLEFNNLTGVEAARFILALDQYIGKGTNVKWSYSTDAGLTYLPFNPYIDSDFGARITQVKLRCDVTSLGGSFQIIDKYMGIYLRYFGDTGYYIGQNEYFTDPLTYPNKITCSLVLHSDSTITGAGTLTEPLASVDDGETWFVLPAKDGYTAVADVDPYYVYVFETPPQASITGATNASPIVITSAGHGFTDGMVVTVASVGGNTSANGTWVVTDADDNTFKLYTTAGVASSGNSEYTTGGTIDFAEFRQLRGGVRLSTDAQYRTPRGKKIAFIASQAS